MVNVAKHIEYWKSGGIEALDYAKETLMSGRYTFAMFFAHLSLEKMVKAHVCRASGDMAPRSHNLTRLLHLTGIKVPEETADFLELMTGFSEIGRYPEFPKATLTDEEANRYMTETERVFKWLMGQL